jgi:pimeloyl-ACP methyl ester carboxylesterase
MELERLLKGAMTLPDMNFLKRYISPTKYEVSKYMNLTVHKRSAKRSHNGAVLLISGGSRLDFAKYAQKFADDLDHDCDLYICTNCNTINILCVDELASFVKQLGSVPLTVIGFSMGGVIGSHVLARAGRKATLITIDTHFSWPTSVCEYEDFFWYRIDRVFYWMTAINSLDFNFSDLREVTSFDGYAKFIERRYGLSRDECIRLNSMNPNMRNCHVASFYLREDVMIHRKSHLPVVGNFRRNLHKSSTFAEHEISLSCPGHCTSMVKPENSRILCRQIRKCLTHLKD